MSESKLWMETAGVLAEKDPELAENVTAMFRDFLDELLRATEPKA